MQTISKETLALGSLEHRNIVPFYGIFNMKDSIGRIGIATPWMQDGTIDEYCKLYPEVPRLPLVRGICIIDKSFTALM